MPLQIFCSPDNKSLQQGDLIKPTPELLNIINEENKKNIEKDILAFMVLTQSCDLIIRKTNPIKADYINLAVIKGLDSLLQDILKNECNNIIDNVYENKDKTKIMDLLERIINQNEEKYCLFYLYPDPDKTNIADHTVVILRNSFSISSKHYDILKKERIVSIKSEFQHKLGWMVGHLYSRVGIDDWSESDELKKEMQSIIDNDLLPNSRYKWISKKKLSYVIKKGLIKKEELTFENVDQNINKVYKKPKQTIIKVIEDILDDVYIKNIKSLFKQLQISTNEESQQILEKTLLDNCSFLKKELMSRLGNDEEFKFYMETLNNME